MSLTVTGTALRNLALNGTALGNGALKGDFFFLTVGLRCESLRHVCFVRAILCQRDHDSVHFYTNTLKISTFIASNIRLALPVLLMRILPITDRHGFGDTDLVPHTLIVNNRAKEDPAACVSPHTIHKRRSTVQREHTVPESEFSAPATNRFVTRTKLAADGRIHLPPAVVAPVTPVVH
jgi:hypothetical protein